MPRSSSGGIAMCYVLPVSWMTSRWAVVGRKTAMRGYSGVAIPGRSLMSMNAWFLNCHQFHAVLSQLYNCSRKINASQKRLRIRQLSHDFVYYQGSYAIRVWCVHDD